ncbi:MAG TPA: hypothetical protein VFL87_08340 [Thermoleophilaceae bacterium]|nr:hypothetical protein [Thermoleophilaceae bacterium]
MNEPAVALAFFDPGRGLHGSARTGFTLLFEHGKPQALAEGPQVERSGDGYRAALGDRFDLSFDPLCDGLQLDGASTRLCRVRGSVGSAQIECLGTATETSAAPRWDELDALRGVSALFDEEHAVLALARRPRGAIGHGQEQVVAWLLAAGEARRVEDARISTVYDGDGRQRNAGLELWMPGEDFPRRASGTAVAGTSLSLEGLRVNAAVFSWRMEGRDGAGAYEVTIRDEPPEAA